MSLSTLNLDRSLVSTITAQRASALEEAKRVRCARADQHRSIAGLASRSAGYAVLANLIESPPDWLERARLHDVLGWAPRTGDRTVDKLIARLDLPHDRRGRPLTVGGEHGLVDRERRLLVAALRYQA